MMFTVQMMTHNVSHLLSANRSIFDLNKKNQVIKASFEVFQRACKLTFNDNIFVITNFLWIISLNHSLCYMNL